MIQLKPHAKFRTPTITPKKTPLIVDNSFHSNAQGQRTHSTQTNCVCAHLVSGSKSQNPLPVVHLQQSIMRQPPSFKHVRKTSLVKLNIVVDHNPGHSDVADQVGPALELVALTSLRPQRQKIVTYLNCSARRTHFTRTNSGQPKLLRWSHLLRSDQFKATKTTPRSIQAQSIENCLKYSTPQKS